VFIYSTESVEENSTLFAVTSLVDAIIDLIMYKDPVRNTQ